MTLRWREGCLVVGLETGMNSLMRSALYATGNSIANLSRMSSTSEPQTTATLVGPVNEVADVLGKVAKQISTNF